MGSIIGMLVGKQIFGQVIDERLARIIANIGIFLLFAGVLGGVYACVRSDAVSDHEVKIEQRAQPATNKAADERAKDEIHNSKQQEERRDVIEAQPDQPIAPTSRALACKRLSEAGKHPPACR